jgi:hypothetical protein
MNDFAELDHALNEIASSGAAEVREDGQWLADLSGLHCEFRHEGKKSLVHLWSDQRTLTRRVLRIKEKTDRHIILEVQRFGRKTPGSLEFVRTDSHRYAVHISRQQFRSRLQRILAESFPDATIESLTTACDLEHSFSGLYVRGRMHENTREWALLAAAPGESAAAIDGMLAFGILWLDWVRNSGGNRGVVGLRLFVPEGASPSLRARAFALSTAARTEIFELSGMDGRMRKIDSTDTGNLESWLVFRHEAESTLAQAGDSIARVRFLAFSDKNAIGTRVPAGTNEVSFSFRGLEFARWSKDGIFFGLGDSREPLTKATQPKLERLIRSLELHRSAPAEQKNHPLFRAAPERWLETIVREDPSKLDAQLDPCHLYAQTPALAAGDRGVLDLLGVTNRGRLVVIELKASEDIQLSLQAMDYWLRVRRHQREGDFQRFGYFAGMQLSEDPPLVWLVAPGLRFHSATDILLKYLSPEIQITRIGVNENWRRGLKVIFRQ